MMCLSQTSGYAVHALSCLHGKNSQVLHLRDVAKCTGVPKPYLAKIINKLNHHGLVYAKRGCRGGIALARPPQEITILQVVEAVEGPLRLNVCAGTGKRRSCKQEGSCPAQPYWVRSQAEVIAVLNSARVDELASTAVHSDRQ